MIFDLRYQGDF